MTLLADAEYQFSTAKIVFKHHAVGVHDVAYKRGRTLSAEDVIRMREIQDPREQMAMERGYASHHGQPVEPRQITEYEIRELGISWPVD